MKTSKLFKLQRSTEVKVETRSELNERSKSNEGPTT